MMVVVVVRKNRATLNQLFNFDYAPQVILHGVIHVAKKRTTKATL